MSPRRYRSTGWKRRAEAYLRPLALTPLQFVYGFRAIGGNCTIIDAFFLDVIVLIDIYSFSIIQHDQTDDKIFYSL